MTITGHNVTIMVGPGVESRTAWLACRFPERPPDDHVLFHFTPPCHACGVVQKAAKLRAAASGDSGDRTI